MGGFHLDIDNRLSRQLLSGPSTTCRSRDRSVRNPLVVSPVGKSQYPRCAVVGLDQHSLGLCAHGGKRTLL